MSRFLPFHNGEHDMFRRLLFLLALPLVLALVACDGDVNIEGNEQQSSSPTEPVTILIGGQCRTAFGRIECEDSSTSRPTGQLDAVRWELRSSTSGISQDNRRGQPDAEISFSGLEPDTYEVEQTVLASDGGSASQVHSDLVITE